MNKNKNSFDEIVFEEITLEDSREIEGGKLEATSLTPFPPRLGGMIAIPPTTIPISHITPADKRK